MIIEQCLRARRPLPKRIQEAPELLPGLDFYLQAWFDLDSCRSPGFDGRTRIPWTAARLWAEEYGLEDEERDEFFYLLSELDTAYLGWEEKRRGGKPK